MRPSATKEKEMVREGEAMSDEEKMMWMAKKKAEMMKGEMMKGKKAKGKKKKDTEIIEGGDGAEGVTKMNDPRKKGMPSLDAADFKADGAAGNCKCQVNKSRSQMKAGKLASVQKGKRAAYPEKPPTGKDVPPSKMKRDGGVWAKGFEMNDAAFVLTEGADKLATEKYAREKRKRNAQGQPHNMIYANTFNT